MTQIAKDAGVSRVSLYRALGEDGNPELSMLLRVLRAMGLQLQAAPANSSSTAKRAKSSGTTSAPRRVIARQTRSRPHVKTAA